MAERKHEIVRLTHPGHGRFHATPTPKGRQVDSRALDEVCAVLGDAPRRRDLLIEHLHRIQDKYGCLTAAHLTALAHEMRLALAEIYETASFYAHFDIVMEEPGAPPVVTVRVCDSIACAIAGADALHAALARTLGESARVLRAPCMGACDHAPAVAVGHNTLDSATAAAVADAVAKRATHPKLPPYRALTAYLTDGGYALLKAVRSGARTPESVMDALDQSGLRGLGGAGFPSGRKWRLVRAQPAPRMFAINADEGEPGTFKDRWFLETDPHRVLEGMLVAAEVVGAAESYIYVRDEYPAAREILLREIAALEQAGLIAPGAVHVRRGAGAYICGEESAMLESIEGKKGWPRHKPPYPAEVGLFGRPTLIHNVETLYWIRDIIEHGAAWFAGHGRNGRKGIRAFSVSGRVREPGVKIAPAGITTRQLIDEVCGGMAPGHTLKGFLPGGASGGILPARLADEPLDFGTLEKHGSFIGSAAVVVFSQADRMADAALNLMQFFEHESCGQCTPCRVGCEKAVQIMSKPTWDTALLTELSRAMADASICGLGQAAPNGLLSVLKFFPDDVPR